MLQRISYTNGCAQERCSCIKSVVTIVVRRLYRGAVRNSVRRGLHLLAIAVLIPFASCTPVDALLERPGVAEFRCRDAKRFTVEYLDGRVLVRTVAEPYELLASRSSIGQKFVSEEVTFIHDGNRGVLVGAAGGPFKNCLEQIQVSK